MISLLPKILSGVLQHHSSKASILWCSVFFTVQLSQLYVTTGKTITLTIQTFVGRVMNHLTIYTYPLFWRILSHLGHHRAEYWVEFPLLYSRLSFHSIESLSRVRLFATPRLQHTRLPCPSPTPRAYSDSCPSCWWCHPTISSSVVSFSSHLQSFPGSGSFQMSQLFAKVLEFQL